MVWKKLEPPAAGESMSVHFLLPEEDETDRPARYAVMQAASPRGLAAQERSFQLSAWMMLPSLYDQVIFS